MHQVLSGESQLALSITTAQRLACTDRTIRSLSEWVTGLNRITHLLHLDDGSSPEDRLQMRRLLRERIPSAQLTEVADIPFPNARHHATMMQIWHEQVKDDDYVFHCEDDWEFIAGGPVITEAIALMEAYPEIGQVGISRKPPETGIQVHEGIRFWIWPHDPTLTHEHVGLHEDYIDPSWPHFTLRPSIIRCEALRKVGNFGRVEKFEHAYARRWAAAGYKTAHLAKKYCFHQAPLPHQSAYAINGTWR